MKLLTIASIFIFAASLMAQDVSLPSIVLSGPSEFDAVVTMDSVDDYVYAYQFIINYDPRVIEPQGDVSNYFGCESLNPYFAVVCNVSEPGVLRVAAYSTYYPIAESGDILRTQWTTVGGDYSPLHFTQGRVFNLWHQIPAEFHDGSVTISGGTGICTELGC